MAFIIKETITFAERLERMNKPELLLPVGNTENFFAAVDGGADAIYLGLKQFNARGRAANFSYPQLDALLKVAKRNNVSVYVTLNTVIKNEEIPDMLEVLNVLSRMPISAVIIQDWGVYHLIKKHFPNITVHASTQMAFHNSNGAAYAQQVGFDRVILARELTLRELKGIKQKTDVELEVFSHGALCYSFSGMCLFSSYLGGNGANRGLCTQPCRRNYNSGDDQHYVFNLKDNQLIDLIPELAELGIASVKIEGRLKPAEYVNKVARAYRRVIDDANELTNAKNILHYDLGREKTAYFMGGNVSESISDSPNTGVYLGKIERIKGPKIYFRSDVELQNGYRVRIRSSRSDEQIAVKVKDLYQNEEGVYSMLCDQRTLKRGDLVFLAGMPEKKFPGRFEGQFKFRQKDLPFGLKKKMISGIIQPERVKQPELYIRIDSVDWLKKIRIDDADGLILRFSRQEWPKLNLDTPFVQRSKHKFIVELPKFIPESDLEFYKKLCRDFHKKGFRRFMLSHVSQKTLIPRKSEILTNENCYVYNDAAAAFLATQNVKRWMYPLENEMINLYKGKDRAGIVPLYFYPDLFYSRMPVKLDRSEEVFKDDKGYSFTRKVQDGITIIRPENPVSLLQYRKQLEAKGFRRFLLDFTGERVSKNIYKKVITRFSKGEQVQPSTTFNFKKGLK
ncbi:U32 family peptidase [Puteibacter caeruleilacunae]|nr:U32 family peptidase [Puteibacter caeruleilacunae]